MEELIVICGGVCLMVLAVLLSMLVLVRDEAVLNCILGLLKTIIYLLQGNKKKKRKTKKAVIRQNNEILQESNESILDEKKDTSWESIFTVNPPPPISSPSLIYTKLDTYSDPELCQRCLKHKAKTLCQYKYCVYCCRQKLDSVCKAHGTGYQYALQVVNDAVNHGGYTELDISYTNLKTCPPLLTSIGPYVESLNLSTNRLSSLPEDIGTLHKLKELFLQYNQLKILPTSICNLSQLYELDVKNNNLKYLPDDIGSLSCLRILCVTKNRLSFLPNSIGKLTQLEELTLHGNELSYLPDELCHLRKLKYLYCGENKLKKLPDTFGRLVSLEELDLEECQLEMLPESIKYCQSLVKAWLSNNKLVKLPVHIGHLKNLKELRLKNNNIRMFPISLKSLNLSTFTAQNNPILTKNGIQRFRHIPSSSFPSLLELTGRAVIGNKICWKGGVIPLHLEDMLNHHGTCTSCGGPFLTYYSCQVELHIIGVFYRLPLYELNCSPHRLIPCVSTKEGIG